MLRERRVEPVIVDYLKTPPDEATIAALLDRLGLEPRELIRVKEPAFGELRLADPGLSRDELIAAMAANPRLIERPIVVSDRGAFLGRPVERVLEAI